MRIGVDFDNTLISYDSLLRTLAAERGLGPSLRGKRAIRDALRASPEGDIAWQRVQGELYGPRLSKAEPMPGALDFLARCRDLDAAVFVVSHKTEFAGYDPTRTPLRAAATAWMRRQGFFDRFGLGQDRVFYESTRREKVARIASLGLDAFIDDLEEVFEEPGYPHQVRAILFDPSGTTETVTTASGVPVTCCASFDEIGRVVFA